MSNFSTLGRWPDTKNVCDECGDEIVYDPEDLNLILTRPKSNPTYPLSIRIVCNYHAEAYEERLLPDEGVDYFRLKIQQDLSERLAELFRADEVKLATSRIIIERDR